MQIKILGGGPAGLYFALLMKKLDPENEIQVVERNPAGATYGWGVVFSDRTLGSFREADYRSYVDIMDELVVWDAIDIRYRNQVIRCEGQAFSGLGRKRLLQILQDHCRRAGVEMVFEKEVSDLSDLAGADLFVAADGVNSLTRRTHEAHFEPKIVEGRSRFVWFGTTVPFDCFTFIFRSNQDGLFQVHAYPFDGTTSTFIVECTEATWRRAGLDQATEEESLVYCENLFAEDLRSHRLMSNRSLWLSFPTVSTRTWTKGNTVLLGDCAHTAHFSIGSGTKLAMEDSIALAESLARHPNVPEALAEFEAARKPMVERFQDAARQSQQYFEKTSRYMHLEPMQFSFHLLSRSGRMGYGDLSLRDPSFVSKVDSWFSENAVSSEDAKSIAILSPPATFVPLRLRTLDVSNRVVVETEPTFAAIEGEVGESHLAALERAVALGAGLVMTESVAVSAHGRVTPRCAGIYTEAQGSAWADLVRAARHDRDVPMGIRLGHAGRRGATAPRWRSVDEPLQQGCWSLLAASAIPYAPGSPVPEEATEERMQEVLQDYVLATERARHAGFDLLQLNMAHGYLLGSFLSPLSNRREDDHGGTIEARARFPLRVLAAVRAAWPDDLPLSVSISAVDWAKGGMKLEDAVRLAVLLKDRGCDVIEVCAGQTMVPSTPRYDPYFLISYSDRIRNEARVCTMATGGIATLDQINTIVAGGRADLCLLLTRDSGIKEKG